MHSADGVGEAGKGVAVSGTEQRFAERLPPAGMFFDLRAEHIGEQIALNIAENCEAFIRQSCLQTVALGVAHELGLDSKDRREIVYQPAAAAEDVEAGDPSDVGMDV